SEGEFVLAAIIDISERKRAEERLRESESRVREARDWLQTTLNSIGDAVIATDPYGRITFLNEVACALTAWSHEDAAGRRLSSVFDISDEETGVRVESPVARAMREQSIVGLANHTVLTARDGRRIPVDDTAAPIRDAAGNLSGVVLVFRDITE